MDHVLLLRGHVSICLLDLSSKLTKISCSAETGMFHCSHNALSFEKRESSSYGFQRPVTHQSLLKAGEIRLTNKMGVGPACKLWGANLIPEEKGVECKLYHGPGAFWEPR
jgi:hypothetical protein